MYLNIVGGTGRACSKSIVIGQGYLREGHTIRI